MAKHKLLTNHSAYNSFVNKRDQVLETMLLHTQAEVSDAFRQMMQATQQIVMQSYHYLSAEVTHLSPRQWRNFDHALQVHMGIGANNIESAWLRLRKDAYIFANAGEQRAIANCGLGNGNKRIPYDKIKALAAGETSLGHLRLRINHALLKLRQKVIAATHLSKLLNADSEQAIKRILNVFPQGEKRVKLKALPRIGRYTESASNETPLGFQYVSDEDWEDILDLYKTEYIPKWRDPRTEAGEALTVPEAEGEGGYLIYPWDVEREITEDFVSKVRSGENEGAVSNGVTDFQWLAIIDDRTDQDCEIRDGLSTQEIEDTIDDGLGSTPPIHFSCRCRTVPIADGLDEIADYDIEDFDAWLNS
jgi:hypothetical protein